MRLDPTRVPRSSEIVGWRKRGASFLIYLICRYNHFISWKSWFGEISWRVEIRGGVFGGGYRTKRKKIKGEGRATRIDGRRSRITKRFHRWREFPSFIGSSLKRISGKSHSGLTGDDRGRQASKVGRPGPDCRRIRQRARRRTKPLAWRGVRHIFFSLSLFRWSLINYARARKCTICHPYFRAKHARARPAPRKQQPGATGCCAK